MKNIGGDFNSIINCNLDKKMEIRIHQKRKNKIIDIMYNFNVTDIWRDKNPSKRKFTWHSNTKPPVSCRLDYFLISDALNNVIKNASSMY